ncbi:MAG: TatD family nuclease-associated radical SAM protein [Oscillospiraceae bacterium]|nr:TatD family nuclease-associated radical SAM protein [Oscillospiraceae bacterium]
MNIFYTLLDKLYVNITNVCSCSCVFCLRESGDGVGDADTLRLSHEPTLDEIKSAFDSCLDNDRLDNKIEIVFCGYGEPMERAETVIAACGYIRSKSTLPLRLNTNGLVKLINPHFDLKKLSVFDSVSISLNAADKEEYFRLVRPRFGIEAYDSMLEFAREAAGYTKVVLTVVDIIGEEHIEKCREIALDIGVPLRVRRHISDNISYS